MCITALPDHLNSQEEIDANFQDDSQFGNGFFGRTWRKFKKSIKAQCAYGYRDIHWYHRWRTTPITLLAFNDGGNWRCESHRFGMSSSFNFIPSHESSWYVSRVQYTASWFVLLQWPLFLCVKYKGIGGYVGAKVDADRICWFPAMWIGKGFK